MHNANTKSLFLNMHRKFIRTKYTSKQKNSQHCKNRSFHKKNYSFERKM